MIQYEFEYYESFRGHIKRYYKQKELHIPGVLVVLSAPEAPSINAVATSSRTGTSNIFVALLKINSFRNFKNFYW